MKVPHIIRTWVLIIILAVNHQFLMGQPSQMMLDEAVAVAREQSVSALKAKRSFISTYWAWRSYKASRLPSLNLYGDLMNFNRSLSLMQSYEDGSLRYTASNYLQNSIGLQMVQNLTLTGGTLYVYSDLSRIDQFGATNNLTWYSQPLTVSVVQPFFGYNRFKWEKRIEPKEYQKGRRTYLESMEQITIDVVDAYFALLASEKALETARSGYANMEKMCSVARNRMALGSVTRDEYLQLELRMLRDSIRVSERSVDVRKAQMALNSLLGYDESREITPVLEDNLPYIYAPYEEVLAKALENSSFALENEIDILNAEAAVAKAKADRGITMGLNARFGLSQTANDFPGVYRNPLNQEVVGLNFSVPIFDWGLGEGKVQKAKAQEDVVRAQVAQKENDFRRTLFTVVGQFDNQRAQCDVSRRAMDIAGERYSLMMDKFRAGNATVTDLINAQNDNDTAVESYISDISKFWSLYYSLRKYTLYDFVEGRDLDVNEKEMLE